MNTVRPFPSSSLSRDVAVERCEAAAGNRHDQPATRRQRRDRDFGVGYGNSSGYASGKRYALVWRQPHFRCA